MTLTKAFGIIAVAALVKLGYIEFNEHQIYEAKRACSDVTYGGARRDVVANVCKRVVDLTGSSYSP